jgi:hypothetical protein
MTDYTDLKRRLRTCASLEDVHEAADAIDALESDLKSEGRATDNALNNMDAALAKVAQLRAALNPFTGIGYGLAIGRQENGACGIILYSGEPHIKRADCEEIEASNMPMDGCILGASVSSGAAAVMIPLLQAKHFDDALAAFTQTEPKGGK